MTDRPDVAQTVSPWLVDSPGSVLQLFRDRPEGLTRLDVARLTGLSRSAVAQRLETLRAHRLLEADSPTTGTRGRPAEILVMSRRGGVFLVADLGATGLRIAVCDAAGAMLCEEYLVIDIAEGPDAILELIRHHGDRLLQHSAPSLPVLGVAIDVPGPVDYETGRVVSPPIMTGWHNFDVRAWFAERYHCPVVVEKDTNAMAVGEHQQLPGGVGSLVFVKMGTGIGTGIVIDGKLYRGADGAAGDIGHIRRSETDDAPLCRCGMPGCVEAYAGGWALVRDLGRVDPGIRSVADIVAAVRGGNRLALTKVREAGHIVGAAVADLVNFINPQMIVFGGQLSALDDIILATARQEIYRRSLPLATRSLVIAPSGLPNPGVVGLTRLIMDRVYSTEVVDARLSQAGS